MLPELRSLILRDLDALVREVEAYPNTAALWAMPAGLPNSGGTLALHLAGNLEHFVGAVLGRTGYVRDREAEFSTRGLAPDEVVRRVVQARAVVGAVLEQLSEADLERDFPVAVGGVRVTQGDFLAHLAVHLGYHLGQLDYHRRAVTGDRTGIGAMALTALFTARADG
jgi:hypothetical protein